MWKCPACGSTVDAVFEVCWNCGTSRDGVADPTFVRADDTGPIADPLVDGFPGIEAADSRPGTLDPNYVLVEAYVARDLMQAHFLVEQLTEAGFPATADEQDMNVALGMMLSGPRVYVRETDLAGAHAWLADYDRNSNVTTD